jgi:hypothetical protein
VPRLCGFYPGICLTTEEKARKNLSQGSHTCAVHVGAFIVIFNVNFNILKQFKCALVGQIKDLIIFPVYKFGSSYVHVNVVKMKSGRRFSGKLSTFVDSFIAADALPYAK